MEQIWTGLALLSATQHITKCNEEKTGDTFNGLIFIVHMENN